MGQKVVNLNEYQEAKKLRLLDELQYHEEQARYYGGKVMEQLFENFKNGDTSAFVEVYELVANEGVIHENTGTPLYYGKNAFSTFHPQEVVMIEADDGYLFEIKANHFVVIKGYTEVYKPSEYTEEYEVLVVANHKGIMIQKLFTNNPEILEIKQDLELYEGFSYRQISYAKAIAEELDIDLTEYANDLGKFIGEHVEQYKESRKNKKKD